MPTWIEQSVLLSLARFGFLPWHMCQLSAEFYENRSSSYCENLLTNKQTDKRTNADENITSLTEVNIDSRGCSVERRGAACERHRLNNSSYCSSDCRVE